MIRPLASFAMANFSLPLRKSGSLESNTMPGFRSSRFKPVWTSRKFPPRNSMVDVSVGKLPGPFIWHGKNGCLDHVHTINWPDSLGFFYARFTEFLGFTPNSDEWKVMGLAPYGRSGINLGRFIDADSSPPRVHYRELFTGGDSL